MEFPLLGPEWEIGEEQVYEIKLFSGEKKTIGTKRVYTKKIVDEKREKREKILEINIFNKVLVQIWFFDLKNTNLMRVRIRVSADYEIYGLENEPPTILPLSGEKGFWGVRLELKVAKSKFWKARIPILPCHLIMEES